MVVCKAEEVNDKAESQKFPTLPRAFSLFKSSSHGSEKRRSSSTHRQAKDTKHHTRRQSGKHVDHVSNEGQAVRSKHLAPQSSRSTSNTESAGGSDREDSDRSHEASRVSPIMENLEISKGAGGGLPRAPYASQTRRRSSNAPSPESWDRYNVHYPQPRNDASGVSIYGPSRSY